MSMVLRTLDLVSYFRFRQVDHRARAMSTALWEYQLVAQHGLEGLRSLLRTGLGSSFTIMDLYRALVSSDCLLCGAFGGFLFLPSATRCCFACVQNSPSLRVVCPTTFAKMTRISAKQRRLLGSPLRTVPGLYSMEQKRAKRPRYLIAEKQAIETLTSLNILRQESVLALERRSEQENQRFMASTAFPWYDLDTASVERGVSCKGCQVRLEASSRDYDARDRVFSEKGFSAHFVHCAEAQALWVESEDGTRPVKEPEFTRRCGYFSVRDDDGLLR
jgi:hypothetical protein